MAFVSFSLLMSLQLERSVQKYVQVISLILSAKPYVHQVTLIFKRVHHKSIFSAFSMEFSLHVSLCQTRGDFKTPERQKDVKIS